MYIFALMMRYLVITLLLLSPFVVDAQYVQGDQAGVAAEQKTEKNSQKQNEPQDRYIFGGNAGLQFGTETAINLSPMIGYFVSKNFMVGVGVTYMYYNLRIYNYSTNIYGARVFGRYYFIQQIFAQFGYEALSIKQYNSSERIMTNGVLGGLGVSIPMGADSYFTIVGLWNFNETAVSPYSNPIFRVGVNFGL